MVQILSILINTALIVAPAMAVPAADNANLDLLLPALDAIKAEMDSAHVHQKRFSDCPVTTQSCRNSGSVDYTCCVGRSFFQCTYDTTTDTCRTWY